MTTTYPHDYRALFEGSESPTIVGGQAVNLWAINYLEAGAPSRASYGSHDLDIVSGPKALAFLKTLANWQFTPTPFKHFGVGVTAKMQSVAPDGRLLLVEVLHSVAGLDRSDLERVSAIEHKGTMFRLLDPVAMLRAKAYNVRHFEQDGNPPRQDRVHLNLIARCVPLYLRDAYESVKAGTLPERGCVDLLSATFKVLQDRDLAPAFAAEGIRPRDVIPQEFATSPYDRIRRAMENQMRLAEAAQAPGPKV